MSSAGAMFDTKRFAAVAIVAVLLLAGLIWIGWASLAVSAIQDRTAQQRDQLSSLVQRSQGLGGEGGDRPGDQGISVYFRGETPAIAAAAVQQTVDGIVDDAGGRVVESQILPVDQAEDSAHRIDLRASFEADIEALQAALYDIETHLPMMMIRSMSVRSFVSRGSGEPDEENPILQISLVVSGYWTSEGQ